MCPREPIPCHKPCVGRMQFALFQLNPKLESGLALPLGTFLLHHPQITYIHWEKLLGQGTPSSAPGKGAVCGTPERAQARSLHPQHGLLSLGKLRQGGR